MFEFLIMCWLVYEFGKNVVVPLLYMCTGNYRGRKTPPYQRPRPQRQEPKPRSQPKGKKTYQLTVTEPGDGGHTFQLDGYCDDDDDLVYPG